MCLQEVVCDDKRTFVKVHVLFYKLAVRLKA